MFSVLFTTCPAIKIIACHRKEIRSLFRFLSINISQFDQVEDQKLSTMEFLNLILTDAFPKLRPGEGGNAVRHVGVRLIRYLLTGIGASRYDLMRDFLAMTEHSRILSHTFIT